MIMYIAKAAWLLRPFNIPVCYFMMPARDAANKNTIYIPDCRLTLNIACISSEW